MTVSSLVDVWEQSVGRYAERDAMAEKSPEGEWIWSSYADIARDVERCRGGLARLGVQPGDRVAFISNNRLEWVAACYATYSLEGVLVPMYEAQPTREWEHILRDSGAKFALVATEDGFHTVSRLATELPDLSTVIGFDLPPDHPHSFARVLDEGARHPVAARHPAPDAVAGFFYTSGTTGLPKGVVLTHGNLTSNLLAVCEVFPLHPDEITLSFLPWAHAYGQVCELHFGLSQGLSMALNDAVPNLLDNLVDVRPTVLIAVPRMFNRIYQAVMQQVAERPRIVRRLLDDGLKVAAAHRRGEKGSLLGELELKVDDRLIFSKIRERFGGRLKMAMSGSAALNTEVAELIDALGITVYEGYGLSETSPLVTANTREHRKLGSVGRPIPGVRVEIDERRGDVRGEGEVIVYGPNVMVGYHGRPEETAAAFTADGGLRTGDLGRIDEDGFLFITGRLKEQYKLENGKYVMPSAVEEQLKLSPFIANIMVHGDGRPYNIAVVAPDDASLADWAKREGYDLDDPTRDRRVQALLLDEMQARSESLRGYEIPRKLLVLNTDFSADNGLLTPTMKVKRGEVLARYRREIDALYAGSDDVRAPISP